VRVGRKVTLDGTRSKGNGKLSCVWLFENESGSKVRERISGCTITRRFRTTRAVYVRLVVTDADGDVNASRKSFVVRRR